MTLKSSVGGVRKLFELCLVPQEVLLLCVATRWMLIPAIIEKFMYFFQRGFSSLFSPYLNPVEHKKESEDKTQNKLDKAEELVLCEN